MTEPAETIANAIEQSADRIGFSIHGVEFRIKAPYAEGHAVTAQEAHVLNAVRADRIRSQFAKRLTATAKGSDLSLEEWMKNLPKDRVADCVIQLAVYDQEYDLNLVSAPTIIQREAMRIAEIVLRTRMNAEGLKPEGLAKDEFKRRCEEFAQTETVRQEARDRVARLSKVATDVFDEMKSAPGGPA